MTYQRGTRRLFAADRKMLTPQDVEGALPSSSTLQVQVQQLHKGKEKMLEESFADEDKERDFDLTEHDEPEQHYTLHGMETIDLEAQDEETIKDIIIQEKEAQVQALMENLERAKYVITYLEQENKQLSDKQVFMELELLKVKRQGDKEALVTLSPIKKEIEDDRDT